MLVVVWMSYRWGIQSVRYGLFLRFEVLGLGVGTLRVVWRWEVWEGGEKMLVVV